MMMIDRDLRQTDLPFSGEVVDVPGVDVEPHGVDVGEAVADEVAHEAVARHVLHLDQGVHLFLKTGLTPVFQNGMIISHLGQLVCFSEFVVHVNVGGEILYRIFGMEEERSPEF